MRFENKGEGVELTTFEWLENTSLAIWVGESLWGYPIMIGLHAIGLGIVVGILIIVDVRVLGSLDGIPFTTLRSLTKFAWAGFIVNMFSGVALFVSQATVFIESVPFLIKITAVLLAVAIAGILQNRFRRRADSWEGGATVDGSTKILAVASILMWLIAIVAGRLVAYI